MLRSAIRTIPRPSRINVTNCRAFIATPRSLRPSLDTPSAQSTTPLSPSLTSSPKKAGKNEGTIASVFATLSGGTLEDALPDRFAQLKQSLVSSPSHAEHLHRTWRDVLSSLNSRVAETSILGGKCIPEIEFPTASSTAAGALENWTDAKTYNAIRERGVAVIRNVIPSKQVLQWKEEIRAYAKANKAKGFPEDNPQVYELYWTQAQLAARSHPNLLATCERFLQLFHRPSNAAATDDIITACSLGHPLNYVDRLRIRQPGDAKFALGAHIDGGGVERWECENFRGLWHHILTEAADWQSHDPWSLGTNGERMTAKTDMYEGPGQCGVFRPLQGWLSMSNTKAGEGTLKVLPFLKESTAYIVLRPFFTPIKPESACSNKAEYLADSNWTLDTTSRKFPGCSLGHNIELSSTTHPHLDLDNTMTSIPSVTPGDMVLWHCDAVHSVESRHGGKGDSSVLYIPAIPTTQVNWRYIMQQKQCFDQGLPPPDFPGGQGESGFQARGTPHMVKDHVARASLGLEKLQAREGADAQETRLVEWCNAQL
ncbi:hypothetical protein PHSY_003792 [Pseudozyma hubeiensis SY62]|uniref:DUF1479 domain protein n=1 Tax=Pseudozyma hubeiensis (strain SY62) TaxID=1305764 RepID=R9P4N7_PSEHS|nr:hypothetical protein PHSY_003792 [Pseudozyma hubeiensis SY62]GAC96212.1 hypothetical protein PHSY_003792 [Pseudozyma hubeiensis SY62]